MRITLIRHGKPIASSNHRVTAVGFAKWVRAYNRSFVCSDSLPPQELQEKLRNSYTFSSDLNRSTHSAEICLGKRADVVLGDLREMDIPRLKIPFKMTINSWLVIARLCWFLGISANSESFKIGRKRVIAAVDHIIDKAIEHKDVAIFGHGISNRFIAKELRRRGWTVKSSSKGFWGQTELVSITKNSN
ncbi:histidine phosphatase family protein [uncultured Vibrio sp.]|uniref:histidine phosphatase family protein n=1 Tax=uncultured Vibrio sp. TaxID=114054 RepID=UPI0025F34F4D|nr:histidine phosphatase family protein [uncultured Vibrio sp.]